MAELKPCPFCGRTRLFVGTSSEITGNDCTDSYQVVCDAEYGGCGATCGAEKSEEAAILAWNRRAEDGN